MYIVEVLQIKKKTVKNESEIVKNYCLDICILCVYVYVFLVYSICKRQCCPSIYIHQTQTYTI